MNDLFKGAQVGDSVAIVGRRGVTTKSTITALTKTQVTVDGAKFTRSRGQEISGTINAWDKRDIRPWTAEIEASITQQAVAADRKTRQSFAEGKLAKASRRITSRLGTLTDEQIKTIEDLAVYVDEAITGILGGSK